MTEDEAKQRHDQFLADARARTPILVPNHWDRFHHIDDRPDSWAFVYRENGPGDPDVYEAVVVRKDGQGQFIVLGAIGKVFRQTLEPPPPARRLGIPRSNERWLGSGPGRYQLFDSGLALWDLNQDLAYPRFFAGREMAGGECLGVVAFADLRGFTPWSKKQGAATIQQLIAALEGVLQDSFADRWCAPLFVKGTGDGMMVVSEATWFSSGSEEGGKDSNSPDSLRRGHLLAFLQSCGKFIRDASTRIPAELALGMGVDMGQLTRVFLFGQSDYLGDAANEAAKLQQLAWNEVVVSPACADRLRLEGAIGQSIFTTGKVLAGRGLRISSSNL